MRAYLHVYSSYCHYFSLLLVLTNLLQVGKVSFKLPTLEDSGSPGEVLLSSSPRHGYSPSR